MLASLFLTLAPGPGRWKVAGRVGDATLSFVVLVTKSGNGPATRCREIFGGFQPNR